MVWFFPFAAKATKRTAVLLGELEYTSVVNTISCVRRTEAGPKLLFLGAYDAAEETKTKFILEKDEYIKLLDKKTGDRRVVPGPAAVVPKPTEETTGVQTGVSLARDE